MSLTKKRLVQEICNHLNLPKTQSALLIENLFELMKSTLASGDDLMISGFGKFFVLKKRSRRGRDSQRGSDLYLDSRRVVRFRPSGVLREKLNGRN